MHKSRNARIIAIMSKITANDGDPAHCNSAQLRHETVVPEENNKAHAYDLREVTQRTYCDEKDNEVDEDFSPDASEYLPSPERQKTIRELSKSLSSLDEDTKLCLLTAPEDKIKTPSTDSIVSFILNQSDFIASPSVIYRKENILSTPKRHGDNTSCSTKTTPVLENTSTQKHKKSRRMIQYPTFSDKKENDIYAPSSSAMATCTQTNNKEEEINPYICEFTINKESTVSQTNYVDSFDFDETLTQANTNCDSTLTDDTLLGDKQETIKENNQTTTNNSHLEPGTGENTKVAYNQDGYYADNSSLVDQMPQPEINDTVSVIRELTPGNVPTQKKLTRKRIRNESERQDQKSKRLKNLGEAYVGCRSKKQFAKKTIKAECKCQKKCGERFTQEQREALFMEYYKIGDHERQWQYIAKHTIAEDVKRITLNRKNNRTQTVKYFFQLETEKVQVCKTFFINTLSISHQTVYTALEKSKSKESMTDKRGQHDNRPRKMSIETEKNIIDHIQLFPTVESHYVRKNSSRQNQNF